MSVPPERLDAVRAEIRRAAGAAPDMRLVVIFGSVAAGSARPDSDVDVGVLGGQFWNQLGVGTAVGQALGREAHVVDLAAASDWLRFEVARKGSLVQEGIPGAWAEFKKNAMIRYWDLAPLLERTAEGVRSRLLREAREARDG